MWRWSGVIYTSGILTLHSDWMKRFTKINLLILQPREQGKLRTVTQLKKNWSENKTFWYESRARSSRFLYIFPFLFDVTWSWLDTKCTILLEWQSIREERISRESSVKIQLCFVLPQILLSCTLRKEQQRLQHYFSNITRNKKKKRLYICWFFSFFFSPFFKSFLKKEKWKR